MCFPDVICPDHVVRLTSIYNSVPSHARPIAQNLVSRTLLSHLEAGAQNKHQIVTTAHPLPFSNIVSANSFNELSLLIYLVCKSRDIAITEQL